MKIDLQKSAAQNMLDLILDANPGAVGKINLTTFDFGAPSAAAGTGGRNTAITLTMKANQAYAGDQTFSYIRLAVNAAIASPVFTYSYTEETTFGELFDAVIAGLGVLPSEVDIGSLPDGAAGAVVNNGDGTVTYDGNIVSLVADVYGLDNPTGPDFTVTAKTGSVCYIGSANIDTTYNRPDIDTILLVTDLDGFEQGD